MKGSVNIWQKIVMYCGRHEEPQEIKPVQNGENFKEPYFSCPCPNCQNGEYYNRITLKDFEAIDSKIEEAMLDMGVAFDMTNFRFELKRKEPQRTLSVKVFEYTNGHIRLNIK